jgi:hypothetical protein
MNIKGKIFVKEMADKERSTRVVLGTATGCLAGYRFEVAKKFSIHGARRSLKGVRSFGVDVNRKPPLRPHSNRRPAFFGCGSAPDPWLFQ